MPLVSRQQRGLFTRRRVLATAAASAAALAMTLTPGIRSGAAQDAPKGQQQLALDAKAKPAPVATRVLAPEGVQFIKPPDPAHLQAKCEVVGRGFRVMNDWRTLEKLHGPPTGRDQAYEAFVYQWIREGCKGDVPFLPTPYSGRWFSAAQSILQNSSHRILLTP